MRFLDHTLQRWRGRMARPWIPEGASILDIGCHRGEFLAALGPRIGPSVGVDPLAEGAAQPRHRFLTEGFRPRMPLDDEAFDAVVLLATLEHIRDKGPLAHECHRLLRPGGRAIITVPSPHVDRVIGLLKRTGLADGMSVEEHHGFEPEDTPVIFRGAGFELEHHRRFQLRLNHLFVFRKPARDVNDGDAVAVGRDDQLQRV